MRRGTFLAIVIALSAFGFAGCGSSGHHAPGITVQITTAPTSMATGAMANVAATVTNDPISGGVTWNCTTTGPTACSSTNFNPTSTGSGMTSSFTAPATAETVTITATSVTNTAIVSSPVTITIGVATQNLSFYVTGEENSPGGPFYSIAGVVTVAIDGSGAILGGEQDYNDGSGINVPADLITSGSIGATTDGTETMTLVTTSGVPGVHGTETFVIVFSETSPFPAATSTHALITQFDGSATSSGSMDLQTATTPPTAGSFSFVADGQDAAGAPFAAGGVFTVTGGQVQGTLDLNDSQGVSRGGTISGSFGTADSFGRGSANNILSPNAFYYVVGPEVLRIIDMDAADTAVGSAYSQGASPNFNNASIGQSVFSIGSALGFYAGAGQFAVTAGTPDSIFSGVGDLNESVIPAGAPLTAAPISGTYNLASTGYGTMNWNAGFGDVATFGIYAVDPTLNILDPNNKTCCPGGALLAEMDALSGIGVLIPQTATTLAGTASAFIFGAQGATSAGDEFDFLGETTVTSSDGAFIGSGALSDPFGALTPNAVRDITVNFNTTMTTDPNPANAGRYTLAPFLMSDPTDTVDFPPIDLTVTAYQASAEEFLWVEVDNGSFFGGSMQFIIGSGPNVIKQKANNQKDH